MADTKLAKIGITVKEPWAAGISYEPLDYVLWRTQDGGDGCGYIAKRANIGVQPDSDDSVWIKSAQAGQSIYDLAVKYHHFDGTEEEFEQQYQQVLQDARDAASDTLATNTEVQNAEALRVAAEQARVSAESARAEAETDRQDAEDARASDESDREAAESARESAEASRQSAETRRASAETSRSTAEVEREMAEEARGEAETEREADFEALKTDMQTAIGQVDAATAAAVATNTSIQSAEADRVAAETARETAESGRVSAESARVSAESGRVTAESGRVSAESARVSAETARAAQASSDHTRAESDHGTAAADHTTAGADHTQAGADHTASEAATAAANTAAAAADAARESIQDDLARKANIDGSYETMSVGLAKNLEGRTDVTGSFLERTTGGDAEVANGLAQLQEVDGKSQVWNQMFGSRENGTYSTAGNDYTYVINNGVVTINGHTDATSRAAFFQNDSITFISGHKYLINGCYGGIDQTTNSYRIWIQSSTAFPAGHRLWSYNGGMIVTALATETVTNSNIYIQLLSGYTATNLVITPQLFDLTLIFGSGNEPATVEEFEAWLASNIGLREYYPYNAGTVLNVNMTSIETLGFNLLDPATGKARIIGAYSDVYGNYYGITGTHGTITFTSDLGETSTITPDSDGKFLLEEPGELTVADAGADCSVFLWWDGTKTEHEDYERTVTNLDVAHIYGKLNGEGDLVKVWPTGMPSIGDIKDSLKVVDGAVVAERKVGEVDLGSLGWDILTANRGEIRSKGSSWGSPKLFGTLDHLINQVNIRGYISAFSNDDLSIYNMVVSFNRLIINDARLANMTSEQVVTALSGTLLYYELATPQTYTDLVYQGSALFADGTPVTMPTNYPVNNWSVERIVPQNSSEAVVTTAPELTCRYSIDAVETLNTHADEIANLYDGLDELDAKKPNKVGDYPGLSVGTARNLSAENAVPAEYVFRKTPDGAATGIATVQRLKGKSVVWNQLVQNGDFSNGTTGWSTTLNTTMSVSDKKATITYVNPSGRAEYGRSLLELIPNHKYLVSAYVTPSASLSVRIELSYGWVKVTKSCTASTRTKVSGIVTAGTSIGIVAFIQIFPILVADPDPTTLVVEDVQLIDLTLMFGAGNEPATVEEFEAMYPLPYYDYNPGEIINNEAEAIETVGFNQWDEEWEVGGIDDSTGSKSTSNSQIRSKNFISCLQATNYYVRGVSGVSVYVYFYDKSGGFIGRAYIDGSYNVRSKIVTTPSNCCYLMLKAGALTTYNNDICINLSDPAKNGTYEPYEKHTLQLGLGSFDVKDSEDNVITVNGLKSAGSVFDEIDLARGKYIKRVGAVDMGELTWQGTGYYYTQNPPADIKLGIATSLANIKCDKYSIATGADITSANVDKAVGVGAMYIVGRDSAYNDAAAFKTAMSGVMLYYELSEPVEYDLVDAIQTNYDVISGGTERRLPEDTASSVLAPIAYDVKYALDAVGILTGLPQNYVSKESLQAMLNAMQSAGIFSAYTMTWDATNHRYTFTFTNNS